MKVLIFTEHNVTPWWRRVSKGLSFASETVIASPFKGDGDYYVMESFYSHRADPGSLDRVYKQLSHDEIEDICARCRLLRCYNRNEAVLDVAAMWLAFEELIDRYAPGVILSLLIDTYVTDVLARMAARRGIRYVGFNASICPGLVMFSSRGEYIPVREPSHEEVEAAIGRLTAPEFTAYIPRKTSYGLTRFAKIYTWWNLRSLVFRAWRHLSGDPLNFYYNLVPDKVPELSVSLSNRRVASYVCPDWNSRAGQTSFERRIFIGLQVNPEASTDYWPKDSSLVDYQKLLQLLVSTMFNAGFTVLLKDHPLMYGFRQVDLFAAMARYPNVIIIPFDVPAPVLIGLCKTTFTWTGTIGFQAAMAGRCSIVVDNYYSNRTDFLVLDSADGVKDLPERIDAFRPPEDLKATQTRLVRHLLAASMPGYIADRGLIRKGDAAAEAHADEIAETLNGYLALALSSPAGLAAGGWPADGGKTCALQQ